MKITIISGSHRNPSQSEKVARHVAKTLQAEHAETETWLFALADNPLPLWERCHTNLNALCGKCFIFYSRSLALFAH